ncbi:11106_t:CDS:2 [Paraglomus brasilianum]|uniref:11106_t:CDS:1 n=1 Tax=Paraglomus brasilianum TaxID=144538 RepID=A0A9N9DH50_9GLOM|nr:11106_t:CDS:2 [Paraglomus brasilianum]
MRLLKWGDKILELLYVESSRILCSNSKKTDDDVKLWRETLDGVSFVDALCRPVGNQFGIVGIQIAGTTMRLNVLMKDLGGIPRYFHLDNAEIPLSPHASNTKALQVDPLSDDAEAEQELIVLIDQMLHISDPLTVEEYILVDNQVVSKEQMMDEEIVKFVNSEDTQEPENNEESESLIKVKDALEGIAAVHQSIQIQQPTATIKRESTENEKNSTQTPTKVTEIAHSAIKTNKLRPMPQPPTKNQ